MLKEFRQFVMRGNVLDLAVGIIIGAAFGKIVSSFVADVITPPLGLLIGRVDFKQLGWTMTTGKDGLPVRIMYGNFLQSVFDFIIVAAAIFVLVKVANKVQDLRKKEEAPPPPPATKTCGECCMDVPVKARKCGHCQSALA
ncbi:MAG: large-conductance mechanosensitive channel protein MscL [Planctomycetia bacterium]|nr:large-conductance mechanosensitive channel protein MscL [Planctomycetia bacterium]